MLLVLFGSLSRLGAAPSPVDYTSLKKFLSARMYCEAYLEVLNLELANKDEDPKLTKLKKELLAKTRQEAEKRAKLNPEDTTVFNILGDIDFQEGKQDEAALHISTARQGNPTALTHYIFAKILFQKGNINQAFDEMEKALQAEPGSEVIFEDFQFLYNCKNYGVASAKRLTGNSGFPRRATPIAAETLAAKTPDNPFENDPTEPPDVVLPPEPGTPTKDPLVTHVPPKEPKEPPPEPDPGPDEPDPGPDEPLPDEIPPRPPVAPPPTPPIAPPVQVTEDPEKKKLKDADYWFEQAKKKFEFGDYNSAEETLAKAESIFPGLPGRDELKQKIEGKRKIDTDYQFAKTLYESEKYDLARDAILKAYEENPEKFAEATFYLGKIYILGSEKDLKKAREMFEKFLGNPNMDPDLKRDVEWVMIGILADDAEYDEAYKRFHEFVERETEYAKNQRTYWRLKYTLWYHQFQTEIHIGIGVFFGAFVLVFILMIVPSLGILVFDPLKRAQTAFAAQKYEKAVGVAEDALRRGKQPIQIQRQLLEICVQSHFALRNFVRCQDHAKQLLNLFPDNQIAWKYLAKAFLETSDNSEEAISMYETLYRQNPENKEYLPVLARYYTAHKVYTVETMEIMLAYFQTDPNDQENVIALAEAFVQNKKMGDEVAGVLEVAIKLKPAQTDFRELLARNYSKKGMYAEAARECLKILEVNINNMGIHVVYTSSMKKMGMLDEAILQYEEFLQKHPGNAQLAEIITGLRKELEQTATGRDTLTPAEDLSPFSEDLMSDGMGELGAGALPTGASTVDVEGFVEPPPEGFENPDKPVPTPDFMKADGSGPAASPPAGGARKPSPGRPGPKTPADEVDELLAIPTMDPFADHQSDLLETGMPEIPPVGGSPGGSGPVEPPAAPPPPRPVSPKPASTPASRTGPSTPSTPPASPPAGSSPEPIPAPKPPKPIAPPMGGGAGDQDLAKARELAGKNKWEEVVQLLSPIFASRRDRSVGLVLADAYLKQKKPDLAKEIVDTLEFDKELMGEDLKDLLYRVGVALEEAKNFAGALELYDIICNVDINFRDAFDRSDRLYSKKK